MDFLGYRVNLGGKIYLFLLSPFIPKLDQTKINLGIKIENIFSESSIFSLSNKENTFSILVILICIMSASRCSVEIAADYV